MERFTGPALLLAALSVAGCSGDELTGSAGDPAGYCVGSFEGGGTGFGCTSCSGVDPFENSPLPEAIDNNGATYRAFGLSAGGGSITIRIEAPAGMSFPAGVDAGALIRFPPGQPVSASYSLYNGTTPVAASSGGVIASGTTPSGAGTDTYYAVTPSATIDRIDLAISVTGNVADAGFRLYEVCGDR